MLARRLPTILPALTEEEALEVVAIHSVAGLLAPNAAVSVARPFRAPHHTLSAAGLIGGGSNPRPGEVSLAHHGVLFLDELQEIPRHVLDALRQPLEDGRVVIARASTSVSFPAQFTLVGAMNPCPCGRAGDPRGGCSCAASEIAHHQSRLSGPLADRIDMQVRLSAVPLRELGRREGGESSAAVRARVEMARARQRERYRGVARVRCNAHAAGRWLDTRTPVDERRARAPRVGGRAVGPFGAGVPSRLESRAHDRGPRRRDRRRVDARRRSAAVPSVGNAGGSSLRRLKPRSRSPCRTR